MSYLKNCPRQGKKKTSLQVSCNTSMIVLDTLFRYVLQMLQRPLLNHHHKSKKYIKHKGQQEVPQLTSTIGCTSVGTSTNSTTSSMSEASMKLVSKVDSDKVWNSLASCIGLHEVAAPGSSTTAMATLWPKRPSRSKLHLGTGVSHLIIRAKKNLITVHFSNTYYDLDFILFFRAVSTWQFWHENSNQNYFANFIM